MLALYRSGLPAAALEVFSRTREHLSSEFGISPGADLRRLQTAILQNDPTLDLIGAGSRRPAPGQALTATTRGRSRDDVPAAPGGTAAATRTLPRDVASFTGREPELDRITAASDAGGVVAIGGMPGVGKTALAVHAAHLVLGRYPDRQLFIDLRAHTPGQDPLPPEAALAGLLTAVGVDARSLPGDLAGRAALWRDRMAGQKAVLVLDNAASSAQVTPLLPEGAGCLVLVTSRRHLGDLPGAIVPVLLEALPPGEARKMFLRLAPRAADSPDGAVADLVALAGFLPLAVSLLARVHARHPSWTLADLAAETQASMVTLAAENDSIAAAFEVSYHHLDTAQQQFFRCMGLHPGTTADTYAAAALTGITLDKAAGYLDALQGEGLLTEIRYRRYGMHDLIRRYAQNLAAADPLAHRDQAVGRLLDYYQHTAAIAEALLTRQSQAAPAQPAEGTPQAAVPALPDRERALRWARAERADLLACLDYTTRTGQHVRVVALTAAIAALLCHDGPWTDAITRHAAAVQAACHLHDKPGQANALINLGITRQLTGDYPSADAALEEALEFYRDLDDRRGQANALISLGITRQLTGDYPGTATALDEALEIYRSLGDRQGQANALNNLGGLRYLTGNHPGAAQALEEALEICRDLDDRRGQASALSSLGVLRRVAGNHPGAAQALEEALEICRDLDDRLGQASALTYLGVVRRVTGDYTGTAAVLEEALEIYRDLGYRLGQANALNFLGAVRRLTGSYSGAAQALAEALGIYRGIGDRGGETEALNELGALHFARSDSAQAEACHRQAQDLAREIGSPWDEAHALAGLGRCAQAAGRTADAQARLHEAQQIFQQIGAAEATGITAELDALTGAGPAVGR